MEKERERQEAKFINNLMKSREDEKKRQRIEQMQRKMGIEPIKNEDLNHGVVDPSGEISSDEEEQKKDLVKENKSMKKKMSITRRMSKIGNYRISTTNLVGEMRNLKDLDVKEDDDVTKRIDTNDFEEIKKTMGDAEMLN